MDLRPDITEAAARLTSGFDVSRELRQLGAHLREGETVHRLAAGVYGSGGGLLAVTNRRVLLLRDGRSGQASEGFPLERLTSVRWVAGPARGAIVVHDAHSTAELTQVEPGEGADVVGFIRSLLPDDAHDDQAADADEEGLVTHGSLALAGSSAATGAVRSVNGAASSASRSGRFAVQMKLRTPRDEQPVGAPGVTPGRAPEQNGRVPEQKRAAGRSGRSHAVSDQAVVPEQAHGHRNGAATGQRRADAAAPTGLPVPERTGGTVVGEVPVTRLAEETGGRRATSQVGQDPAGTGPGRTRPDPIDDTGELTSSRPASHGGETLTDDRMPGRRGADQGAKQSRKKWILIGSGAAAVVALAVVGSVIVVSRHSGPPSTVNPAPAAADSSAGSTGPVVRVTKVINGDTIEVQGPVSGLVEIIGISAPRADKEQCGAADTTGFATRTLSGSKVTLVTDPSQPPTDRSGRRLASLRTESGFDYAVLAAQAGMVRYYDSAPPVAQAKEIKAGQAEAEKAGRGLWGPPCNGKLGTTSSTGAAGSAKNVGSGQSGSGNGQSGSGQSGNGQSGSGQSGSGQSGNGQSGNGNGQSGSGQSGSGISRTSGTSTSSETDSLSGSDTGG